MGKGRLEAFSDGVIAIIITIMVLDLKVPHGEGWIELWFIWPVFLSYVLSFVNIGIYWNNHHHLLHAADRVSAGILWSNMHLLFWLSLLPFTTGWMGENHFAPIPLAVYSFDLLMCAIAYTILELQIIKLHGKDSILAKALGGDRKGKLSLLAYVCAVPLALVGLSWVSGLLIVTVALMWLVPDRRIERTLNDK
jgi:uncharacterized membrane protein